MLGITFSDLNGDLNNSLLLNFFGRILALLIISTISDNTSLIAECDVVSSYLALGEDYSDFALIFGFIGSSQRTIYALSIKLLILLINLANSNACWFLKYYNFIH